MYVYSQKLNESKKCIGGRLETGAQHCSNAKHYTEKKMPGTLPKIYLEVTSSVELDKLPRNSKCLLGLMMCWRCVSSSIQIEVLVIDFGRGSNFLHHKM